MKKLNLTHEDVAERADALARRIADDCGHIMEPLRCYPIPRGGVPAAYLVQRHFSPAGFRLLDHPHNAHFALDDIVDSGRTAVEMRNNFDLETYALVHKIREGEHRWIVFPWETKDELGGPTENVVRLLEFAGEDTQRPGLLETPQRYIDALAEWCKGYTQSPAEVLKTFDDGANGVDEMVVVRDLPFYSLCEHHMAPFFGTATIGYVPNGKIVGLSKLSRLLDVFARRLQVQERLTNQVAESLVEHLAPLGVGVELRARHLCMESRGICKQGHETVTRAFRGVLKDKPEARAEFLQR